MCYHKIFNMHFKEDGGIKRFINKIYGLTPDTMYTTTTTSSSVNNNNMDMGNNFYYGNFVYPQFYGGLNFQEHNYYYDQQQIFNAYNYSPIHTRLDFNSLGNNR